MRSMQIINWGKPLELREMETPIPKGSEVLIQVEACGVCHSDLHIRSGFFDLGKGEKFPIEERGVFTPFTMGHEPVGTVVATGQSSDEGIIGKSFTIYPWISCDKCEPCINGYTQVCDSPNIIGTRVDGAYSDYVIVPDKKYLFDYSGINVDLACTLACSGLTTFSALRKIQPEFLGSQDCVLIIGAGGLGLTAICLLKSMSKARIIVSDISGEHRRIAKDLGANYCIDPGDSNSIGNLQAYAHHNNGKGIAATLDLVGLPETMKFGLSNLRKGGHHVHVGLFGGAHTISLPPLAFRMLKISGSYVGSLREFKELIDLIKSGVKLPIPITQRPLKEASFALDDLEAGNVIGRIVLKP
mgnify:FL=1